MEGVEELWLCFVCLSTYQFFVESDCQKPTKLKQKNQTKNKPKPQPALRKSAQG